MGPLKPQGLEPRDTYLRALEEAATALDDILREVEGLSADIKAKARAQRALAALYEAGL